MIFQIQTFAQTTDDTDSLTDQNAALCNIIARHSTFGLGNAVKTTLHQHLHQTMGACLRGLRHAIDFLVLPKGQHRIHVLPRHN
ncbi:hypothetical protein D3C77_330640 [compost metagenome]